MVPRGTREPETQRSLKTLLETWPLLLPPNGEVVSRVAEGRTPCDLSRGVSGEADLRGANLRTAVLRGANLCNADLRDALQWHF
jgi:hypothetical protein